jgi:hypothetical protein
LRASFCWCGERIGFAPEFDAVGFGVGSAARGAFENATAFEFRGDAKDRVERRSTAGMMTISQGASAFISLASCGRAAVVPVTFLAENLFASGRLELAHLVRFKASRGHSRIYRPSLPILSIKLAGSKVASGKSRRSSRRDACPRFYCM